MKNQNNSSNYLSINRKTLNSLNYKLNVGSYQNIQLENRNLQLTLNEFDKYLKIISKSNNCINNLELKYELYKQKFKFYQENAGFLSNVWQFNEYYNNCQ